MFRALTCPSSGWLKLVHEIILYYDARSKNHQSISICYEVAESTHSVQSALNRCNVRPFTDSDDTRCCVNKIFSPEDGHVNALNMSRIIV